MARVIFLTEKLPPEVDTISDFSYSMMCSLAEQQHEIHVLSTYHRDLAPPMHPRLNFLRPFRKWSWLEVPMVMPILLNLAPDILHIVQPRAEALSGLTNAMTAIAASRAMLGHAKIVTSFYDIMERDLTRHKFILANSQAVTVSNRLQLDLVRSWIPNTKHPPHLSVIGVPQRSATQFDSPSEPWLSFVNEAELLLFVPGNIDRHTNPRALFDVLAQILDRLPKLRIVVGGGWGLIPIREREHLMRPFSAKNGGRILVTGNLTPGAELFCLAEADLVFTASLPPESLTLNRIASAAVSTASPIVIGQRHAHLDPRPWHRDESAYICADHPNAWKATLEDKLRIDDGRSLGARRPEFSRAESADQPANLMSRIYAQLIAESR